MSVPDPATATVAQVFMAAKAAKEDPTPLPDIDTLRGVPDHVQALLARLHEASADQEARIRPEEYMDMTFAKAMEDKYIALEADKCRFVYTLLQSTGATNVVEAGTSYGVSTIYLALAAAANAARGQTGSDGTKKRARVIATEHEPAKAQKAREHWEACGPAVRSVIDLREGDLLATLQTDLGEVDALLLDIWIPMALPALKLVQPSLRRGAVVITDNTTSAGKPYRELLTYLRDPANGFVNTTLPYKGGVEMSVYQPAA